MSASGIRFSIPDIVDTPAFYPVTFDTAQERVLLTRMSEADYRMLSFLDERMLAPGARAVWVPELELAIASRQIKNRPLHFFFHSGHVGSTLLSRLLDELPGVLGLREPAPLRTLADEYDRLGLGGIEQFNGRIAMFLSLWSRGFKDTRAVIVKSTSIASRIAPSLLAIAAKSRAIYLNVGLETYLATYLANENMRDDIAVYAPLRTARLSAMLGTQPRLPQSRGVAIAQAWLTERLNQQTTQNAGGDRVRAVDFDQMLADIPTVLGQIVSHFGVKAGSAAIAKLADSPVLRRYSKAPERHEFSASDRIARLKKALTNHAGEAAKARAFVAEIARRNTNVAALVRYEP